jgi:hypothetical protein
LAFALSIAELAGLAIIVAVAVAFLAFRRDVRSNPGIVEIAGLSACFDITSVLTRLA